MDYAECRRCEQRAEAVPICMDCGLCEDCHEHPFVIGEDRQEG